MKTYTFKHRKGTNVLITIEAQSYTQAMEWLLRTLRNIEDFEYQPNNN